MASEGKPSAEELARLMKDVVDKARLYGEATILFSDLLWKKGAGFDSNIFFDREKASAELQRASIEYTKAIKRAHDK